jgi:hypothetical protein
VNALRAVSSLGLNNQLASQLTNLQASNAAIAFPAAAAATGPASAQTLFFRTQNGSILAPAAGSQAILTGLAGLQGLTGLGALPNGVHTGQTVTTAGPAVSNQQSHQSQLINSQTLNLNNQRLAYAAAHRQAQALNNLAAVQHHLNQTNIQVAQQQAQALNLQNHLATLAAFSAAQQQQQSPQQTSQNQTQQAASSYLANPSSSSTQSPQSSHVQSSNSSQTTTNTSNTNLLAASLLQQRPTNAGLQIQGGYT